MGTGAARRCLFSLAVFAGAIACAGAGEWGYARASVGTQVVITSSAVSTPGLSGETAVSVALSAQDSLSDFEIHLTYDSSVIEVEDADAIVMNARWDPPTGLPLVIDASTPGVVKVSASTGDPCPVGGTCSLFSFAWRALANGTTQLSATFVTLSGTKSGTPGTLAGVSVLAGTATVGAAPPTATATPSPTATPTPTATATVTSTPNTSPTATATGVGTIAAPVTGSPTSVVTTARPDTGSTPRVPAQAPDSGNGLMPDSALLGQVGLMVMLVAALLSFALIMSSLRMQPAMSHSSEPVRPPGKSKAEIEMEIIAHYLRTMEALGTASSDIGMDGPTGADADRDQEA